MLRSSLMLPMPGAELLLPVQIKHLQEHDFQPVKVDENRYHVLSEYGLLEISAIKQGLSLVVEASRDDAMDVMRDFVASYLLEHMPELKMEDLVWQGQDLVEGLPLNFRQMIVVGKKELNKGMLRITLSGRKLEPFVDGGLHFRLLLPKNPDNEAVWPVRLSSGKVQFPSGKNELYNRVYTARFARPEEGEIDIDIVRHQGGVASQWAEEVTIGTVIGIMGPGGGGIPQTKQILMGGDETALPAIARILENVSVDTVGQVYLLIRKNEYREDLQKPKNVNITWLTDKDDQLVEALLKSNLSCKEECYFWFGGEQQQARKIRNHIKGVWELSPKQYYCSTFWQNDRMENVALPE